MRRILLMFALLAVGSLVATGVALAGKTGVSAKPSHVNFGKVTVGTSSSIIEVQFTNNTGWNIYLGSFDKTGDDASDFSMLDSTCLSGTADGGTCSLYVRFHPSHTGHEGAKLTFNWSTGQDSTTIGVGGTGVSG